MKATEAIQYCDELEGMVGDGPGEIYGCLDRIKKIEFAFRSHEHPYVREKARDAAEFLSIWRSANKWRQWGDNPSGLESTVRNCIAVLRMSINASE